MVPNIIFGITLMPLNMIPSWSSLDPRADILRYINVQLNSLDPWGSLFFLLYQPRLIVQS